MSSNIGILGLGVMGKNLAWNIEDKKYSVSIHSRDNNEINDTIQKSHYQKIYPAYNLKEFVDSLEKPRTGCDRYGRRCFNTYASER